jgi:starch synthase
VVDANETTLDDGSANGFVFDTPDVTAFVGAIRRALDLYRRPPQWRRLQLTGMSQSFDWAESAGHYLSLYARKSSGDSHASQET